MSRGGAPNRMAVIMLIQAAPPPRPACYPDDHAWREWLVGAHVSGLRVVRRVDVGKSQGCRQTSHRLLPTRQIPFCSNCTQGYQRRMEAEGKCHPCDVTLPETETA